jgi:uncharacterized membrane protein YdjX (TVP38/TMEM64 family)
VAEPLPAPVKARLLSRIAIAILALAALVALFRLLPVAAWIEALKAYGKAQGAAGAVVFGLVYVGASLIPGGPAALLTLAAGAVYGVVAGTALVSVASVTAATLAFLLARGALRERVQRMAGGNAKFAGLNRAIGKEGAKIVALVRLSPAFPFTIVNYLFGLTPVPLPAYVLSSWLAMLPGTLAYVYFGSALGAVTGESTPLEKGIRIALGAAAVVATVLIARIAAKAIRSAGVDGTEALPAPGPGSVS